MQFLKSHSAIALIGLLISPNFVYAARNPIFKSLLKDMEYASFTKSELVFREAPKSFNLDVKALRDLAENDSTGNFFSYCLFNKFNRPDKFFEYEQKTGCLPNRNTSTFAERKLRVDGKSWFLSFDNSHPFLENVLHIGLLGESEIYFEVDFSEKTDSANNSNPPSLKIKFRHSMDSKLSRFLLFHWEYVFLPGAFKSLEEVLKEQTGDPEIRLYAEIEPFNGMNGEFDKLKVELPDDPRTAKLTIEHIVNMFLHDPSGISLMNESVKYSEARICREAIEGK